MALREAAGGVVVLTNFLPPYRRPLFSALADRFPGLSVWTDVVSESDRLWVEERKQPSWQRRIRGFTVARRKNMDAGRDMHLGLLLPLQLLHARPKVVLSAELGWRTLMACLYSASFRRTYLVLWLCLSEHTERNRGPIRTFLRRWALSRSREVVVHSQSARRYVERLHPGAAVTVVPQASDRPVVPAPRLRERSSSGLRLVFIGSVTPRKNLPWLAAQLDAWLTRRDMDGPVTLVVAGALRDDAVESLRLTALDVRFMGHVSYDAIPELLAEADALIHPTLEDEWGLVVNEALSLAVPVIGSTGSEAVNELIVDGLNGFTFDPDSPRSLFASLDHLQAQIDAGNLSSMRDAALRSAEAASMHNMIEHFGRVIHRGLGR